MAGYEIRKHKMGHSNNPLTDFNRNKVPVLEKHEALITHGDCSTMATSHIVEEGIKIIYKDVLPKLGFQLQEPQKPTQRNELPIHKLRIPQ